MNAKRLTLLCAILVPVCAGSSLRAADGAAGAKTRTVRLLTVGNSFSQNATHFLGDLAKAAGHVLVHHQAVIGGATMAQHWEKVEQHEKDPDDKRGLYGTRRSLKQELRAEPWDFVTIQQASIRSHDLAGYQPYAGRLHAYIKKHASGAEVLLHQTWAYRRDDPRFAATSPKPGEPATQEAMYQGLTHAYETIAAELGVRVIPVGDAFHLADTDPKWGYRPDAKFDFKNARPPALPDQAHSLHAGWRWVKQEDGKPALRMDGHHANAAGEYLGACVFYEVLFGDSAVGNPFVPRGIDADYARFLQETAHRAVVNARAKPSRAAAPAPSGKVEGIDGKSYDLLVIGGTAGVFTELLRNIERHYRTTCGEQSRDYQTARTGGHCGRVRRATPGRAERARGWKGAAVGDALRALGLKPDDPLPRAGACRLMFEILDRSPGP